ncbi:transposase is200-family protein [Leptolyngbya sp. Heron Island J]|uniref:transposase n=1 Tax=Leptolyngbya sp. Heron Island J TaxID=1385935 RepID=UPI0003B985A4|nr:transposase [Leptolyngbya sp. Heron Island J]ESA37316.1 transposase is200-family protein [Leptolyngbya sp. Heron Island J]
MMELYQNLPHSKWDCTCHILFVPKYRRKVMFGEIRKFLGPIFHEKFPLSHQTIMSEVLLDKALLFPAAEGIERLNYVVDMSLEIRGCLQKVFTQVNDRFNIPCSFGYLEGSLDRFKLSTLMSKIEDSGKTKVSLQVKVELLRPIPSPGRSYTCNSAFVSEDPFFPTLEELVEQYDAALESSQIVPSAEKYLAYDNPVWPTISVILEQYTKTLKKLS